MFKDKIILVTGGTGSFGNYIVHRLLTKDVKEIRILSRDEKKQYDMRIHYKNNPKLKFFIGDIRDFSPCK
jgi:UDP-glucose 4-epimerase